MLWVRNGRTGSHSVRVGVDWVGLNWGGLLRARADCLGLGLIGLGLGLVGVDCLGLQLIHFIDLRSVVVVDADEVGMCRVLVPAQVGARVQARPCLLVELEGGQLGVPVQGRWRVRAGFARWG